MKKIHLLIYLFFACQTIAQQLDEFISFGPGAQTQLLKIPCGHTFQLILKEGDILSDGTNLPASADFTAYFEIQPDSGVLTINHENVSGSVTKHGISYNSIQKIWTPGISSYINFSDVVGTYRPCSGGMSPWGTLFCGEEYNSTADINTDGYLDAGWLYEVDPISGSLLDQNSNGLKDKNWHMGRMLHENVCFSQDSLTAYFGSDNATTGYLYKFVADQKGDFSEGTLYVLKKTTLLSPVGVWLQVPNSTPDQCDSVANFALANGATNFNRVEDVEVGPDGKIYFAATTNGRIYRLQDDVDSVSQFAIFVNNQTYTIQTESGPTSFAWGAGTDNLCFDQEGNLWALQDNSFGYILVVGSNHTTSVPNIRIFGQTPLGSEPTGINFSPDGNFLFMSLQHPTATNSAVQFDAAGDGVVFNKASTVVIARKEFLGSEIDAQFLSPTSDICLDSIPVLLQTNAYSGVFSGAGVVNDTLYTLSAGSGNHAIEFTYLDSSGCVMHLIDSVFIHNLPMLEISSDSIFCFSDSLIQINSNFNPTLFSGSSISTDGIFNPQVIGNGYHTFYAYYQDQFLCAAQDSVLIQILIPEYPVVTGFDSSYCKNALPDTFVFQTTNTFFNQSQGISGFTFYPELTTDSIINFGLTNIDTNGCHYYLNFEMEIFLPVENSISNLPVSICQNADTVHLNLIPSGGILSGPGVVAENFVPVDSPVGMQQINYTTTDLNGCIFTSNASVFVVAPAAVSAGSDAIECADGNYQLDGFPIGGNWFGPQSDVNGLVNLNAAGIGIFEYIYSTSDPNGCLNSDTMTLEIVDCLGLTENTGSSEFFVFPNPASDQFTIRYYLKQAGSVFVKVTDMTGNIFIAKPIDMQPIGIYTESFDSSEISDGIYIITIMVEGASVSKKLIISRN